MRGKENPPSRPNPRISRRGFLALATAVGALGVAGGVLTQKTDNDNPAQPVPEALKEQAARDFDFISQFAERLGPKNPRENALWDAANYEFSQAREQDGNTRAKVHKVLLERVLANSENESIKDAYTKVQNNNIVIELVSKLSVNNTSYLTDFDSKQHDKKPKYTVLVSSDQLDKEGDLELVIFEIVRQINAIELLRLKGDSEGISPEDRFKFERSLVKNPDSMRDIANRSYEIQNQVYLKHRGLVEMPNLIFINSRRAEFLRAVAKYLEGMRPQPTPIPIPTQRRE